MAGSSCQFIRTASHIVQWLCTYFERHTICHFYTLEDSYTHEDVYTYGYCAFQYSIEDSPTIKDAVSYKYCALPDQNAGDTIQDEYAGDAF